jgi:hypothetical protein
MQRCGVTISSPRRADDFGCFPGPRIHGAAVSLNVCEQRLYDHLRSRPEEGRHWREKVRAAARSAPDGHAAAARLAADLWRYYEERSAAAEPFRGFARREGLSRTSMRNLAELLLRLWIEPPRGRPAGNLPFS